MSESNELVEKRQELAAKQKLLGDVFVAAGKDIDFSKKSVLELLGATDSTDAVTKVKALNSDLIRVGDAVRTGEMEEIKRAHRARGEEMATPAFPGTHPSSADLTAKSFGDLVASSEEYKAFKKGGFKAGQFASVGVDISIKTLMQVAINGFPPEAVRSGLLVPGMTRPIQVLDLIPLRTTTQNADKYMEETTRTHSAAETSEGAAYPESSFIWTERTESVQKIGDSIPVTDEQLEDEAAVSGLINQRLSFGIRQRLDLQVLVGDGTSRTPH